MTIPVRLLETPDGQSLSFGSHLNTYSVCIKYENHGSWISCHVCTYGYILVIDVYTIIVHEYTHHGILKNASTGYYEGNQIYVCHSAILVPQVNFSVFYLCVSKTFV